MTTKQCSCCNESKAVDEFYPRQRKCKPCYNKRYRDRYESDPEYRAQKTLSRETRIEANRQFVWDYLKSHPCVDCGESDLRVLEFDHVRGTKKVGITRAVHAHNLDILSEEIDKCEVRCANCHRIKTYSQLEWRMPPEADEYGNLD